MSKALYTIIFCIVLHGFTLAQSGTPTSMFIDCSNNKSMRQIKNEEALRQTNIIHVNNLSKSSDFKEIIRKIYDLSNLNTLIISKSSLKSWPNEIADMTFLEEIIIIDCEELNLKNTFKQMQELPILSKMRLTRNDIEYLPKEIGLLENLESISISRNRNLDVEDAIDKLKSLPKLKNLGLPVNQIIEIPPNINDLKYLEELDIRDNNLTDLPEEVGELYDLEALNLEKNILVNPVKTLKKFSGINLKYLSLDKDLTNDELEQIRQVFPEAIIEEVMEDDFEAFDENIDVPELTDSILDDFDAVNEETFIKTQSDVRLMSLAYLKYADFFDKEIYDYDFDSTSFEARFLSKAYHYLNKVDTLNPENNSAGLYLLLANKCPKDEVRFLIKTRWSRSGTHFPELDAFRGMYWVVDEAKYDKKTFKNHFIGKKLFRPSTINYNDIRIDYLPHHKKFRIRLKGVDSTYSFLAYPRSSSFSKEIDLKTYEKRASKYIKELDKRRLKFHKQMFRDENEYKRAILKSKIRAWSDFRRIYLSKEEQDLKKPEWLEYYFNVLSNEDQALRNSEVSTKYVERWLRLKDFRDRSDYNDKIRDSATLAGLFTFRDDDGNNMIVTKLVVIDKTEKEFAFYDGSNGLKEIPLYLKERNSYSIIGWFFNGDIGVLGNMDMEQISFTGQVNSLKMSRINKDLASIGMVVSKVGLAGL